MITANIDSEHFKIRLADGNTRGWFEHKTLGDDCAGDLWFENSVLIDYEGIYLIPEEVLQSLEIHGFDCKDIRDESRQD